MKNYVVYRGNKFAIELYYTSTEGCSVLDYLNALSSVRKEKVLYLFRLMAERGAILNEQKFRHEGDQIYAFKAHPDRLLCFFFVGKKIIVTNAFEKKTQKLPEREKRIALKYRKDYVMRVNKGTYYYE